jgi:hypothetical protein
MYRFRVVVKPRHIPENLILDGLESNNIVELSFEVEEYLRDINITDYRIIGIHEATQVAVSFNDIMLN